jgi:sporulation protein YlmC with PRC-barrel domain
MWQQRAVRTASAHLIRIEPKRGYPRPLVPGSLIHLSEVADDYRVADPVPDVRDWVVTLLDGRHVGVVEDLIIDTTTMSARYAEVRIDRDTLSGKEHRWMLVPVESIRIDAKSARVMVDYVPESALADATRHHGRLPTADEERIIHAYFDTTPAEASHG